MADVSDAARLRTLYQGLIGTLTQLALGVFERGEARTYAFTVSFPEKGAADNAFQRAQLLVQFDWTAVGQ